MKWKFHPLLSWSTVSVCCPAGRVTLASTVVQVSYPPVFGIVTEPLRFVPERVVDVQRVRDPVRGGDPERDRVGAGRGHVDGVVEPLPGCRPAHVVRAGAGVALGVGGRLKVDPVGAVAVGGAVGGGDVVGDALPAGVVVGRVDGAGHGRRRAAVRGPGGGRGGGVHAPRYRHRGQDRGGNADAAHAAHPGAGRRRPISLGNCTDPIPRAPVSFPPFPPGASVPWSVIVGRRFLPCVPSPLRIARRTTADGTHVHSAPNLGLRLSGVLTPRLRPVKGGPTPPPPPRTLDEPTWRW